MGGNGLFYEIGRSLERFVAIGWVWCATTRRIFRLANRLKQSYL